MQIHPAPRATPPPAPPPPHPTLCISRSNLQEFPVQWVGPATLLTPEPVPSGFCPDLQTLAAPLPLQIRGRNSGATRGAGDHAGSPGGWGGGALRIRIKAKKAEGKWGFLEFETHATCPSHGGC